MHDFFLLSQTIPHQLLFVVASQSSPEAPVKNFAVLVNQVLGTEDYVLFVKFYQVWVGHLDYFNSGA